MTTFETCAICADNGRILGCVKWTVEQTANDDGSITGPTTEGPPSEETKRALKQFCSRHTVWAASPDGKPHWYCPEDGRVKHTLSEAAYRRIVFNQVIAMAPADPPEPLEHGYRQIELRRDHAGGGALASFDFVYEHYQSNPDASALKFTWIGAQTKSVPSIILSRTDQITGESLEPFVEDDDAHNNDFASLSAVVATAEVLDRLLSNFAEELRTSVDHDDDPVMLTLVANLGAQDAIGARRRIGQTVLREALLEVATSVPLNDAELDAISYMSLNFCQGPPIRRV